MKYIITILMLWGVAFGQCTSADTVTSNSVSSVTPTSAYITGTPAVNDSIFAYTLTYVQIGTTDTVRVTGDDPAAAITGLTNNTAYGYYWRTRCLTNTSIYQLRLYTFRTAQSIVYTPMTAAGYEFKYIKADSGFALPIRDTFIGRGVNRAGLQVWKSGDGLYIYDGTYWRKIGDKYFKFDNNFTVTQVADTFNVFLNNGGSAIPSDRLIQATVYLNDSTVVIPDSTLISRGGVTTFIVKDSFLINSEPDDIYRVYAVVVNAANLLDTIRGVADSFRAINPSLRDGDILVSWITLLGTGFNTPIVASTIQGNSVLTGRNNAIYSDSADFNYNGTTMGIHQPVSDPSAAIDIGGVTQGFLPPRVTTFQMNNIVAPATGLLVYNTTVGAPYYYNGVTWVASTAGSLQQAFSVSGYPQITMGTTDPFAIYFDPFIDNGVTGLSMNPSTKEIILGDSSKGNAGYLSVISGAGISAGGLLYRVSPSKRMVIYDTLTQAIDYQAIPGGGSSQWTDTLTGAITYPGDIYVGGRTLLNGNVGIGTTTPDSALHLVEGIKQTNNYYTAAPTNTMLVWDSVSGGFGHQAIPSGGSATDTTPTMHYWGAFGQSNMEEQSSAGDSLYKKDWTPNPQVQVYVSGSWVTANRYTNNIATGAIPVRENSVVVAAQQYLLKHPYDTIRIITSIQSNTALSSWTKPQTGFGEKDTVNHMYYITNTKLTTQIPAGYYLECIFWQQGEKNEQDTTTNAWLYMIKALDSTYKTYSSVSPNLRQIFAYPTTTYPAMRAVFDSVRRNVIDLTGHDFGVVTHDYSTGVDATHLNGYQTAMVGMAFNINFQYRYTNLTNIPWAVRAGSANGDTTISIKPVVSNASAVSVTFGNGTTRFVNKPVEIQTNLAVNGGNIYTSGTNFTYTTATTGGQYKAASTSSTSYTTVVGYEAYLGGFTSVRGAGFYGFTDATGGGAKIITSSSGASFNSQAVWIDRAGRTGLGTGISSSVLPSAWLTLSPGAAAASGAPLKFLSGTNLTTPENGAVEYNGTDYFATSGGVRYTLQRVTTVPASAGATGVTGSIAYDSSFIYVCVATNTWVRAALATW